MRRQPAAQLALQRGGVGGIRSKACGDVVRIVEEEQEGLVRPTVALHPWPTDSRARSRATRGSVVYGLEGLEGLLI